MSAWGVPWRPPTCRSPSSGGCWTRSPAPTWPSGYGSACRAHPFSPSTRSRTGPSSKPPSGLPPPCSTRSEDVRLGYKKADSEEPLQKAKMQIALMIEGQEDVNWVDWQAIAAACEEHGVGTLFRSDHYLSVDDRRERGSLDAWSTIAALAAVTERLRLGTLVSPATFRHPAGLAKAAGAADHFSGGRVELGIGAGWWERE